MKEEDDPLFMEKGGGGGGALLHLCVRVCSSFWIAKLSESSA